MATQGHTLPGQINQDSNLIPCPSSGEPLPRGSAALLPTCLLGAGGSIYLTSGRAKERKAQTRESLRMSWRRYIHQTRSSPTSELPGLGHTSALLLKQFGLQPHGTPNRRGPVRQPWSGLSDSRSVSLHITLLGTGKQTPPSVAVGPWGCAPTLG